MSFVNLHLHTDNSLMDGTIKIEELAERVKELGQNAVAITDHGNCYGAIELYTAAKKCGIKPIIGIEAYLVSNVENKKEKRTHITLIAKNNEGLKNLFRLVTFANEHGFHYKPRMDLAALERCHEGLICLSGCLGSMLAQLTIHKEYDKFDEVLERLREIFGHDFYLEIQDTGVKEQLLVIEYYRKIAPKRKLSIVCTNDAHYLLPQDEFAQEVMVTMLQNKTLLDPVRNYGDKQSSGRYRFDGGGYYVCSEQDMLKKFHSSEVDLSQSIADQCNIIIDFDQFRVPKFDTDGRDSFEVLRELCSKGWREKNITTRHNASTYRDRIEYELNVIREAGLADYFLIVADINRFCRENGIPVGPGRGSAAACLISYLTGITKNVDPIEYDLIFERFYNPGRSHAIGYDYGEYSFDQFRKSQAIS